VQDGIDVERVEPEYRIVVAERGREVLGDRQATDGDAEPLRVIVGRVGLDVFVDEPADYIPANTTIIYRYIGIYM